jgi:hypothetical protein
MISASALADKDAAPASANCGCFVYIDFADFSGDMPASTSGQVNRANFNAQPAQVPQDEARRSELNVLAGHSTE